MTWFYLAITSASFSAAAALFQKKILKSMEALEFSMLLSLFNVILSIPFLMNIDYQNLSLINLSVLYFKSILGSLAFLSVMLAIKNLEISKALPLLALTPGLVAIFAFIFIGDALTLTQTGAIMILILGTYLLEIKKGNKIFDPFIILIRSRNHQYIIYALLLFTATSIIDRMLLSRYSLPPDSFIGFQHIFFALNFLIIFIIYKRNFRSLIYASTGSVWYLIMLVSLLTVTYRYTEILSIKIAPVALVLSVKRISIFFAVIIGGKIFREKNLLTKSLATALIIIGTILIIK